MFQNVILGKFVLLMFLVPELVSGASLRAAGTGTHDGLAVWLVGNDLYSNVSQPCSYSTRTTHHTYINVYRINSDTLFHRIHCYDGIILKPSSGGEQAITLGLKDPDVVRIFMDQGLRFQVIHPASVSRKWTDKLKVEWKRNRIIVKNNFQNTPMGALEKSEIKNSSAWNPMGFTSYSTYAFTTANNKTHPYASIENGGGVDKILSVLTPAGKFSTLGTSTGAGLVYTTRFCQDGQCSKNTHTALRGTTWERGFEELYLSYRVRFKSCGGSDRPFDFTKGAKLPGLAGGHAGVATGGGHFNRGTLHIKPNGKNGWSGRSMVRYHDDGVNQPYGKILSYLYYPDYIEGYDGKRSIRDPKGSSLSPWAQYYGDPIDWKDSSGKAMKFYRDRWYSIQMRYKMNTIGATGWRDGILQVKVDGNTVLDIRNIRYRLKNRVSSNPWHEGHHDMNKTLDIDRLMFQSFNGGGDASYAPKNDSCTQFDDLYVYEPHK